MTHSKYQPRGVAMIIVLAVVAVATILSFGLIGSQSILAQASGNGNRAMQADALAESGLQLAAYYLKNPDQAPVLNAAGFYPGQNNVSLGNDSQGTVDITVTKLDDTTFDIACTAKSGDQATVLRTVGARAQMEWAYVAPQAASVNGAMNLYNNITINGSLKAAGTVTAYSGSTVSGTIYAPSILGSLLGIVNRVLGVVTDIAQAAPPTVKDLKNYGYKGKSYNGNVLSDTTTVAGPTASNPLGVYYASGNFTIRNNLVLNGTLIVDGDLEINAANVTITAAEGMPALVVHKKLLIKGSNRNVTSNGLSWIKGGIARSGLLGLNNKLTFNGALQFPTSAAVEPSYGGTITVNYDRARTKVTNFVENVDQVPYSLKLTSYSSGAN